MSERPVEQPKVADAKPARKLKAGAGQDAGETMLTVAEAKPEAAKPAPKVQEVKPAPKPEAAKPAPKVEEVKPAPKPEAAKPAPKVEEVKPALKPEAAKLAPKPEAAKPAPKAEAPKPAPPAAPAKPQAPAKPPPAKAPPAKKVDPLDDPAPPQKTAETPQVRPPAKQARPRGRHIFLVSSFIFTIVLPVAFTAFYLWTRAVDQYSSDVGFSVRTEEQGAAIEMLVGMTNLSGSSSSDTDILFAFLSSQELVSNVNKRVNLREIWSKADPARDPFFAFDPEGTIEDLMSHWERKIAIVYDSGTGLIDVRALAFDPNDALRIAEVLLDECNKMINNLSSIAREDSIKYTREELENAVERLKIARRELTQFRNRTQIVDPSIDTQNQMGLLVTLQQQLAEALIESDLLQDTTRENDPRVTQAQRRIEVINARIASERRKLGLGEDDTGEAFANVVGEYESLIVDREFAEQAYTAALAAHDAALAEARKQSRYLAAHVKPTLAEKSLYPERLKILAILTLFAFFTWSILCLVYYSLRDRS